MPFLHPFIMWLTLLFNAEALKRAPEKSGDIFVSGVRSSSPYPVLNELGNHHDLPAESETSTTDDFPRSLRGRDNFIRFGRGKNDNFMRFGRGKQDNFMRFGRSNDVENETERENNKYNNRLTRSGIGKKKSEKFERLTKNFIRLGRGKPDNFMRLGRAKQDNFMRFGKGKPDNFMRFGRGKQENFMRFGRGNKGNFMRFGRGKVGNYMRFGRDIVNFDLPIPILKENLDVNDLLRYTMVNPDDYSSHFISSNDESVPIAMRSLSGDYNNFDRFSRSRQDNFMRFGKSDSTQQSSKARVFSDEELKNNLSFNSDSAATSLGNDFTRVTKSDPNDGVNLFRQGRHPPNKDDSFIRFGRESLDSQSADETPQRLKRSTVEFNEEQEDNMLPSEVRDGTRYRILYPIFSVTDYNDEDPSYSESLEGYNRKRKRSVKFKSMPSSPIDNTISSLDGVSSNLVDSGKPSDTFVIPFFLPLTSTLSSSQE